MKIEILLIALSFGLSQASFETNLTIYPIDHPNNEEVPGKPWDTVSMFYWEHSLMMFFTGMRHYFETSKPSEDFLNCFEKNINFYYDVSKFFKANVTKVINYMNKHHQKLPEKPRNRAENALLELVAYFQEFGKQMDTLIIEENPEPTKSLMEKYKAKISKSENTLVRVLNKLAMKNSNVIEEINRLLKEINVQIQRDAISFIMKIQSCVMSQN